jgi:hypothetical protein
MNELRDENSKKPFTERYFALDNPFSLASQMLIKVPSTLPEMAQNIRTTLASTASILLSPTKLANTLSGMAASSNRLVFAEGIGAVGSGHGVEEFGFSNDEWNTIQTDPDYRWEKLAEYVEPKWDDMEKDYRECYTYEKQSDRPERCTAGLMTGERPLKWRLYNAISDGAVVLSGDVYKQEDQ